MSTYRVVLKSAAFAYITVEAGDEDEAVDLAFENIPYICAQCSGGVRDDQPALELGDHWEVDDYDGAVSVVDE